MAREVEFCRFPGEHEDCWFSAPTQLNLDSIPVCVAAALRGDTSPQPVPVLVTPPLFMFASSPGCETPDGVRLLERAGALPISLSGSEADSGSCGEELRDGCDTDNDAFVTEPNAGRGRTFAPFLGASQGGRCLIVPNFPS